jgi:hypothetical protein
MRLAAILLIVSWQLHEKVSSDDRMAHILQSNFKKVVLGAVL